MYFGVFLNLWLAVGFIVALKVIYLDKGLEPKKLEKWYLENKEEFDRDKTSNLAYRLLSNKYTFIVIITLFGFVSLYWDITSKN